MTDPAATTPPAPGDEVSLHIAASPEALYAIVTDVSRMGELSPECTGGTWQGGATGPAVGATFKGTNKRGYARWSTSNTVVEADPGRAFAWETKQSGVRWGFRFAAEGDGTLVTEHRREFKDRPLVAKVFAKLALGGVAEHEDELRDGMRATLERLKAVAETSA